DELRDRNRVERPAPLGEVDRAVEMGAAVLVGRESAGRIPVAAFRLRPDVLAVPEAGGIRPVDRLFVEGPGQVDELRLVGNQARSGRGGRRRAVDDGCRTPSRIRGARARMAPSAA